MTITHRESAAFNALPFRDKLDHLYGVSAVEKRDLIIGAPDAERLVRSFAVESLFSTLKEIGLEDSTDLIALASGEQIRGLVDFDCWRKDRFDPDELLSWLSVVSEAGNRALGELLNSVDLSLLVFFLKQFVRVRRKEDPEEPFEDLVGDEVFELDEHYEIGFHRWESRGPLVRQLLEELYERDYGYFVTVMEEIWWGVDSELEERSFQARNMRLQDRGFPDFYEALEIYRPLDAAKLPLRREPLRRRGGDEGDVPLAQSLLLPEEATQSFFGEILSRAFAAEGGEELRHEMAFLANRVMVADGVDFADREAVAGAVRATHDTLNLALESLARDDRELGIELVRRHHLLHLFRHGWQHLLELRRAAKRAEEAIGIAVQGDEVPFLDSPYREALAGFARAKPRWFAGIDVPGESRYQPLGSTRDLARARETLAEIESIPALFASVLGQPVSRIAALRPSAADDFRLSAALLTGFARALLDGEPSLRPLGLPELVELRRRTVDAESGGLRADARETFLALAPNAGDYLDLCLRRFEEEFLALDPAYPIDPRFVTCLMIAIDSEAAASRP